MSKAEDFLTQKEEDEVVEAIRQAELNTSGEIRVHLEQHASIDVFERAVEVFDFLHMDNTKRSNGVLIYVAVEDRELVIMGDKGINDIVGPMFWESTKNTIVDHFKQGDMCKGLRDGILMAGEQLKKHFPYKKGDINELPNAISVGPSV
jgi:uncharacterized membrane protein